MILKLSLCGLIVIVISCQEAQQKNIMESKSDYKEGFIQSPSIKLHYLDWGGSGQTLILIHGLGDSPYIFEDLADTLKQNFRIIAYSKRGHCKTENLGGDYDNTTLVSDLKLLMDSMKLDKAHLLGWSAGGNEITEFAIRFPERTNKLIFFESGYDYSDEAFKNIIKTLPKSPFPDSSSLQSLDAYRIWYHQFWFADVSWNPTLEKNLKASVHINPDSSITTIPNDDIFKSMMTSIKAYHRDYKMIQAPALAIYSKPFFMPPVRDEKIVAAYEAMENNIIMPWRWRSMKQIQAELKNLTIKEMPKGTHASFVFLSRDYLVETINSFLLN